MSRLRAPQAARRGWLALGGLLSLLGGCENMSHTDRGILTGGGIGAVAGTVIGAATGHPGAGAAIGAAAGGVAGGVAGASADAADRKAQRAWAAQVARMPTIQDIVTLTQNGTSDAIIIDQIRSTGAIYNLTTNDITYLQQNGVREPVIREMQATAYRVPRRVYVPAPMVEPGVVVYPAPPPPVAVGVGVSVPLR